MTNIKRKISTIRTDCLLHEPFTAREQKYVEVLDELLNDYVIIRKDKLEDNVEIKSFIDYEGYPRLEASLKPYYIDYLLPDIVDPIAVKEEMQDGIKSRYVFCFERKFNEGENNES